MRWPEPELGLVISYEYLWAPEAAEGRETGVKTRPCAIVVAARSEQGETVVMVAPITHSRPRDDQSHLELPLAVKRHLGLDDERSWVVTDQLNRFVWPGYDVRPRADDPRRIDYGFLPPALFDRIKAQIAACWAAQRGKTVKRT